MNDKKYLDKVVEHLVKGTKIDYENESIVFPFSSSPFSYLSPKESFTHFLNNKFSLIYFLPFTKYYGNQFGLTEEEIRYVYLRYVKIIEDKIEDGE